MVEEYTKQEASRTVFTMKMEAVRSCDMKINLYQTTPLHIPEMYSSNIE
jgi:hypothetical protein